MGALVARLVTGGIIEKIDYRKILFIGLAIYFISSFLYYPISNLFILYLVRFIHGVCFGTASVVTGTVVAQLIPFSRRGEGIGYYSLSTTLASAIGPMLGMFLVRELSFNMIVTVSVLLLIISSFAGLILTLPKRVKISGNPHNKISIHHFIETKAVPISMICALLGIGYSSIVSFLTSYTTQLNLVEAGSFFFMVYSVAILISRPVSGRLLDTKGGNFIMHPTFVSFAIGLFLLGMTNNGWILLLAAAFVGVGFSTLFLVIKR